MTCHRVDNRGHEALWSQWKCVNYVRKRMYVLEMDSSSSEEVTFTIGEKFSSFSELSDKKRISRRRTLCNCISSIREPLRQLLIINASQRSSLVKNLSILNLNTRVFMVGKFSKHYHRPKDQTKSKPNIMNCLIVICNILRIVWAERFNLFTHLINVW